MKVCFLTVTYVSPTIGGLERVIYTLTKGLRAKGIQVFDLCINQPSTEAERDDSILVLPKDNAKKVEFMEKLIINEHIEILINQSPNQAELELSKEVAQRCGCKLIATWHTAPFSALKGLKDIDVANRCLSGALNRWVYSAKWWIRFPYRYYTRRKYFAYKLRNIYMQSDAVVLLSESFKPSFVRLTGIKYDSHLYAISNPIELVQHPSTHKEKIILFVARMEFEAKRPDRIVKIWEKMHRKFTDWKLIMIGDGGAKEPLMTYCKRHNINNIEFTGRTDPNPYYEKASILCVTSSYEGFGLTITEGQSHGVVPVVYDSYESLGDLVEDSVTGFRVKAFDEKAYIKVLERLMTQDALREKMSKAALNAPSLANCAVSNITDQWIELFKKLS